ncbi:MAG TPA: hypothetical protein VF160_18325 [Candidatus Dormibacteraeota bacterium]
MRLARAALLSVVTFWLLGASPVLAATNPPDLAGVLVDPPSSDFQAVPNGGSSNFGPQDANAIASNSSDANAARQRLTKDQFTRGYEKGWVQQATGMVLVEGVYEFKLNSGARDYFGASKTGDSSNTDFKGFFDTPGLNPAYGAHFKSSDGFPSDAVVFVKGNLNLVVVMGNRNGVDSNRVLTQAKAEYTFAPANTLPQSGGSNSGSSPAINPALLGLFTGIVLVVAVLAGVIALFLRRRSPAPAAAAAAAAPSLTLSGDGRYWWDGAGWHDADTSVPPGAQRSPDGAYWYDGSRWRTVPGWQPR